MQKKQTVRKTVVVPLAIGVAISLLYLLPAWRILDYGAYDMFLGLKQAVAEDRSIVLLDIDDASIDKIGTYPWPRGLLAQGLEALAELEAGYAIFDIEYLEKSPMSVDTTYLRGPLRTEFETAFEEIGSNMDDVFQALVNSRISLSEAGEYGQALIEYIDGARDGLYDKTTMVAIENDIYLGQAMRMFGNTFSTLNMQTEAVGDVFKDRIPIAEERFSYPKVRIEGRTPSENESFLIAIPEISAMTRGAGFTNVAIDGDGVRRRIQLVDEVDGRSYLQLAMSPLMHKLGDPEIVLRDRELLIQGAMYGDVARDVRIPLDSEGKMLIRWPKKLYRYSFQHIGFHELLQYRSDGESLASHLRILKANQGWTLGPGYAPIDACLEAWDASERLRIAALESGSGDDRSA